LDGSMVLRPPQIGGLLTTNMSFPAGVVARASGTLAPLGPDLVTGDLTVSVSTRSGGSGTVHLVLDVTGYYGPN
jgi:hypothetical protein